MRFARLAVAFALVFLLAGSTPVFADRPRNNLSLTFNGAILSSGTQGYSSSGGNLDGGYALGQPVNPDTDNLSYSVQAHVSGLSVQGSASFSLTRAGNDGSVTIVKGNAQIAGMIPAETFPLGCTLGVDCTSGIPGVFFGPASITTQTCTTPTQKSGGDGSWHSGWGRERSPKTCAVTSKMTLPMEFESAFLNPFGGPIFLASDGGEILLIADYASARVTWTGIQLGGTATGSLAGSPVAGGFSMGVSAFEDLKSGTEFEVGSIALVEMNPSFLNAAGHFVGKSTIPPGTACPDSLGFPPGTCQLTGFSSSGFFSMEASSGGSIVGTYSTAWTVPAVAFTSTVTAAYSRGHY